MSAAAVLLAVALMIQPSAGARLRHIGTPRNTQGRITRSRFGALMARLPAVSAFDALPAAAGVAAAAAGTGPGPAVAAMMAAALVAIRRRRRRRRQAERRHGEAMATALDILVGDLSAGAHPVSAFAAAAAESEGEVAAELQAVAARARMGSDVVAGLRAVAANSSAPRYWTRVAVCWQLAAEHGLPMSLLMRAAHRDITERQRFGDRVEAGVAGARATAMILAGLPVLGVVLGQLVGAHPVRFLLGPGSGLLLLGVLLICAGVWWADRIIDGAAR